MTKTTKEGTNFYNIKEAANKIGLIGTGYRVEDILKLRELNEPFIAQIRIDSYFHFVVVYKMNDNKMLIMDPAKGRMEIDVFDFSNSFTGNIMLFEKKGDVLVLKSSKEITKILFSSIINNRYCILFVFILSIVFTSLSCLISLYSKFVFAFAVSNSDCKPFCKVVPAAHAFVGEMINARHKRFGAYYLKYSLC